MIVSCICCDANTDINAAILIEYGYYCLDCWNNLNEDEKRELEGKNV